MPPVNSRRCLDTGIRLCNPADQAVVQFQFIIQPVFLFIDGFLIVFVFVFVFVVEYYVIFIVAVVLFFILVGILSNSCQPERLAILESVICRTALSQSVQQRPNRECKRRRIAGHTGHSTICFR